MTPRCHESPADVPPARRLRPTRRPGFPGRPRRLFRLVGFAASAAVAASLAACAQSTSDDDLASSLYGDGSSPAASTGSTPATIRATDPAAQAEIEAAIKGSGLDVSELDELYGEFEPFDGEDSGILADANIYAMELCMKSKGFDELMEDYVTLSPGDIDPATVTYHHGGWGILSPERGEEYGYREDPDDPMQFTTTDLPSYPPGYFEARDGWPLEELEEHQEPGGCRAEIAELFDKDLDPESDQAMSDAQEQADEATMARPEIAEMKRDWSACMARDGYHYAEPAEARGDFISVINYADGTSTETPKTSEPTTEEKAVAAQDARCKREVDFMGRYYTLRNEEARRAIAANRPALEEYRDNRLVLLRNAQRALSLTTWPPPPFPD